MQSRDLALDGQDLVSMLQSAWNQAAEDMKFAKEAMVEQANKEVRERVSTEFKKGDQVLLQKHVRSDAKAKLSAKLRFGWEGPWKIIKMIGDSGAVLQNVRTKKTKRAHVDNLAPWKVEDQVTTADNAPQDRRLP